MFTIKFKALDAVGNVKRFSVVEPAGPNAERYAWERAMQICKRKAWTCLKFA